ncbi:hypothetical protein NFHSH190041_19140 [Shewanella sp. NFH-SH190041]|uniref:putative toxin n=1 Tax=Shewanella sp. NFH-SH190041 TaxID=2950245 RepID=UPI0021FCDBD8|nr:hypothetical protein NFHSH190041_19140 [Shewanella sp. NFH-SH190041]
MQITQPSGQHQSFSYNAYGKISIDGFIPDLPVNSEYGVTDIKNVQHLANSDQLRAFYKHAVSNKMEFSIIISPRTKYVSGPLLDQIRNTNGKLYEYNQDTKTLTPIDIGSDGLWKR